MYESVGVTTASAVHRVSARGAWWESRVFLALVVVATMIPLLYPPIPPLVDLLGHMGRYRIELDLDHSPWLQRYYDYHWAVIGNLGVDLLIIPLSKLVGLEMAVKLIVIAIPPLTATGFLWVAREVHGRIPPTAFFALPFAYGYPFLFGFVNFTLAAALAFLAVALWLRLGRLQRTRLRGWLFVPISIAVFFCHVFAWCLLALMCFSAEIVRLHEGGRGWAHAGFGSALRTSVMAFPLLSLLAWHGHTQPGTTESWFDFSAKIQWILSALRDRWKWFDIGSVAIAMIVIVEARRRERFTFARNLAFAALALIAVFLLAPDVVSGSAYADMRYVPYLFALALLAIGVRGSAKRFQWVAAAGVAFFFIRIAATTISLATAANHQQARLAAIKELPTGARVATLVGVPCGLQWPLPRGSHLGAMVIVRRSGFSNDQWLIPGVNLLGLRHTAARLYAADPSELVQPPDCRESYAPWSLNDALKALPRDAFDYVWLIDPPAFDRSLLHGMQPVWRGRGTTLYRIDRIPPA